ncbi:MAG: TIGR00645 family protein [Alphaproteobacteria bacterium]
MRAKPMTSSKSTVNPVEGALERGLFASRWLMAPFYVGLVVALAGLMVKFVQQLVEPVPHFLALKETEVILWVLTLIDLSLAANLLLMVIFAGYENFVSRMHVGEHPDRPDWMGTIDFSGMKLKLIASIVAISGIQLLKVFMSIDATPRADLPWLIGLHLTFVVSGVLLALMDFIHERSERR